MVLCKILGRVYFPKIINENHNSALCNHHQKKGPQLFIGIPFSESILGDSLFLSLTQEPTMGGENMETPQYFYFTPLFFNLQAYVIDRTETYMPDIKACQ